MAGLLSKIMAVGKSYQPETVNEDYLTLIEKCRRKLRVFMSVKKCAPLIIDLGLHSRRTWTKTGADASVKNAVTDLETLKEQFPTLSYNDFYQLAEFVAIEVTEGLADLSVNAEYLKLIERCRQTLKVFMAENNKCASLILDLRWHVRGPFGTMKDELTNGDKANFEIVVRDLKPLKEQFPTLSHSDFYQLAGFVAVEVTGGLVSSHPGREDKPEPLVDGRLPDGIQGNDITRLGIDVADMFDAQYPMMTYWVCEFCGYRDNHTEYCQICEYQSLERLLGSWVKNLKLEVRPKET